MLEDGAIFERRGFDGEQALQFITDEGRYLIINSSILFRPISFAFPLNEDMKQGPRTVPCLFEV